jgi:transposase
MSMGETPENQQELWVATQDIPKSPGHPFYQKLNRVLSEAGFDRKVQEWCEPYYAKAGRPSIPPGVYFRMLMIGYFEGIDSQRGIAWRCRDSLSLKEFLGFAVTESTPDHSSLTYIRKRLPLEVHHRVFGAILGLTVLIGSLRRRWTSQVPLAVRFRGLLATGTQFRIPAVVG